MQGRLVVLASLWMFAPLAPAQDMMGVEVDGDLFVIDSATGQSAHVGNLDMMGVWAMAIHPSGPIVSCSTFSPPDSWESQLYWVDPALAKAFPVAKEWDLPLWITGLASDATGLLYAIVNHSITISGEDELWTLEIWSRTATRIGPTGAIGIFALTMTQEGTLYGSCFDHDMGLVMIDRTTGAATDVAPGLGGMQHSLAARSDGALIGSFQMLSVVDPVSGASVPIGGGGYELFGCDFIQFPCGVRLSEGCAGAGGRIPELAFYGCLAGGAGTSVSIGNGLGGAYAVLLVGPDDGHSAVAHHCVLNVTSAAGGVLVKLGGKGPGKGSVSLAAYVPAELSGQTFVLQAFVADPHVPLGFSATPGRRVRVQ